MVDWATFSAVLVSDIPMRRCCYFSSHGGRCVGHISSRSPLSLHCLCPNNIWYTYTHKKTQEDRQKLTELTEGLEIYGDKWGKTHTQTHVCTHTHLHKETQSQKTSVLCSYNKQRQTTKRDIRMYEPRNVRLNTSFPDTRIHTHTHTASTRQTHTMAAAELCRSLERRKGSISLQRKKEEHVCECVTEIFLSCRKFLL